jgi:hypothetical protein
MQVQSSLRSRAEIVSRSHGGQVQGTARKKRLAEAERNGDRNSARAPAPGGRMVSQDELARQRLTMYG